MRILVTGANGQVGRSMLDLNGQDGYEIIGLSRQQFDLTKPEEFDRIVDQLEPDAIINAAAYTAVDKAEDEPDLVNQINAFAPGIMASVAAKSGLPFIQISTDYVFDGENEDLYTENDSPNPINVYGKSKFEGEVRVRANNTDAIILRTSWVFSPFSRNFLKTIACSIALGNNIKVVNDQLGTPTSAKTTAKACLRLLKNKQIGEIFHFSGLDLMSWYDFAVSIEKGMYLYRRSKIASCNSAEYVTRAPRPKRTGLDNSKIRFRSNIDHPTIYDEIKECLNSLINNESLNLTRNFRK